MTPMQAEREMSRGGAVALGAVVALVGIAIIAVGLFAPAGKFEAPRWVVMSAGGAFFLFGGWTAVLYAAGFDPKNPDATMPPPLVQLAVFLPAFLCLAAPFHWVAFGPGPRAFSTSVSLPFTSASRVSHGWTGRAAFGAGAILMDVMVVALVVSVVNKSRRRAKPPAP
jgi:hypothetical protein